MFGGEGAFEFIGGDQDAHALFLGGKGRFVEKSRAFLANH